MLVNSVSQNQSGRSKIVVCPTCGGDSVYAVANPFRPFCSERCKNIDFGAWASEAFRVPSENQVQPQVAPDAH